MHKFSFLSFFTLAIVVISGTITFEKYGWNKEFMTFFFFAACTATCSAKEVFIYRAHPNKHAFEKDQSVVVILILVLFSLSFVFIGAMHILGNLDFPRFMFIDGWKNRYVFATRIVWFLTSFVSVLFIDSFCIDIRTMKPMKSCLRRREINLGTTLFKALLVLPISIPTFVLLADSFGVTLVRSSVNSFLLFVR